MHVLLSVFAIVGYVYADNCCCLCLWQWRQQLWSLRTKHDVVRCLRRHNERWKHVRYLRRHSSFCSIPLQPSNQTGALVRTCHYGILFSSPVLRGCVSFGCRPIHYFLFLSGSESLKS